MAILADHATLIPKLSMAQCARSAVQLYEPEPPCSLSPRGATIIGDGNGESSYNFDFGKRRSSKEAMAVMSAMGDSYNLDYLRRRCSKEAANKVSTAPKSGILQPHGSVKMTPRSTIGTPKMTPRSIGNALKMTPTKTPRSSLTTPRSSLTTPRSTTHSTIGHTPHSTSTLQDHVASVRHMQLRHQDSLRELEKMVYDPICQEEEEEKECVRRMSKQLSEASLHFEKTTATVLKESCEKLTSAMKTIQNAGCLQEPTMTRSVTFMTADDEVVSLRAKLAAAEERARCLEKARDEVRADHTLEMKTLKDQYETQHEHQTQRANAAEIALHGLRAEFQLYKERMERQQTQTEQSALEQTRRELEAKARAEMTKAKQEHGEVTDQLHARIADLEHEVTYHAEALANWELARARFQAEIAEMKSTYADELGEAEQRETELLRMLDQFHDTVAKQLISSHPNKKIPNQLERRDSNDSSASTQADESSPPQTMDSLPSYVYN